VIKSFQDGDTAFLRAWPGNLSAFLSPDSKIKIDQITVAAIPSDRDDSPSHSCLGGWNLMISAKTSSEKKEAAWEFIKFVTSETQQKYRAIEIGTLPSLKSLYNDTELLEKVDVMNLAKEVVRNAKPRPISPNYMDFSPKISAAFNKVLKGEVLPIYAVSALQEELEAIDAKLIVQQ